MTLSQQLWQQNQDLVEASLNHPFVQGIADGSLDQQCFAFYVAQDAFFLDSFARAYSIAAAKAVDWESFNIFHQLAGGVLAELNLHQGYAQQWGVDLQQVTPSPATRHYTDFLLATAWGSEVGLTACAMTPCMRLYHFLGTQLAQKGVGNHQYSDWIKTYNDSEFGQLVATLEGLVDGYVTETEKANSSYRYALQCEYDFFAAAWHLAES
ncbi:transcriptional activator, TenA family [Halothece sp. PCC 7418]|uniref:TenA family protein n=1 Tax=Halothece sp. (strain PCC 7418) TaxID=65093 RepID=UPI0002A06EAF|nr:TenA family protein [Halothece sp. PCC 7418]AFZ43898.1 transcriptional activator, TenA family [Halothece sp. PCC 7418]